MLNARVAVSDLYGIPLPRGCLNGWLAMLGAYFDDSGTHDASEVVVVAGIMGLESDLVTLDGLWREHLDRPLDGHKSPIKEFHASHCFSSTGEFVGWTRTETDYYRHQLQDVIIRSHVSGYGFACVRQEYDEVVQGDLRLILGDSEGHAASQCIVRALRWARIATFDPDISFVFDCKASRNRETKAIFDAFQLHEKEKNLVGVSFLNSEKTLALQAADLFAWEFYQYAQQILKVGMSAPATAGMKNLAENMYYVDGQIARKSAMKKIKALWAKGDQELFRLNANYFGNFRPSPTRGSSRSAAKKQKQSLS